MSPRSTSPDFLPERNHPDKTHLRMRLMPAVVQQYRRMQASVSRRPVQIQSGASQARGQANGQAIDSRAARYPDVRCEATAQLNQRAGSLRHSAQVLIKFRPRPNPVSTIVNTRRARQRSGGPLPFRKTWRVCPKQPAALWYTSPNFNEYRTPSLRMANLAGSIKGVMIGRSPCEQTPHWRGQTILMEFA